MSEGIGNITRKNNTYFSILFFNLLRYIHLNTPITKTPLTILPIKICLKARVEVPEDDPIS
jgi:hypothetical protein